MALKTARLTILVDPELKTRFEAACHSIDMTPSQVVRRLVRDFSESRTVKRNAGKARAPTAKT